ncbi:MAG: hypothetical protein ABI168_10620 [Ginsengibacter sp.]
MKKLIILIVGISFFYGCKKSDSGGGGAIAESYLNTSTGSSWSYHETNRSSGTPQNSDYTLTSTSKDTSINSKSYHIYTFSYGGSQYLAHNVHDYYQYDSIPGALGQIFERLYLRDNTNTNASWSQQILIPIPGLPVSIPVDIDNMIIEKGLTKVINGITYKNVIHVSTTISSSAIPSASLTSDIHSYYAPNYGLINNNTIVHLDYAGVKQDVNIATSLISASLK